MTVSRNPVASGDRPDRPQIDSIRTRAELGALLSELRRRSGYSLRKLASEVGSSPSTVSGWCRAENLPFPSQFDVFAAMLERLGIDDPDSWLQLVDELRTTGSATNGPVTRPYRGLEPFRAQDAELFFGRGRLLEEVNARIDRIADGEPGPSIVLLVGPSGSGKSSLLHAGVLHRLRSAQVPCLQLSPGADPLSRLQAAVAHDPDEPSDPIAPAGRSTTGVDRTSPRIARAVLVDQLEEVFTASDDPDQREGFLAELERIATGDRPRPASWWHRCGSTSTGTWSRPATSRWHSSMPR